MAEGGPYPNDPPDDNEGWLYKWFRAIDLPFEWAYSSSFSESIKRTRNALDSIDLSAVINPAAPGTLQIISEPRDTVAAQQVNSLQTFLADFVAEYCLGAESGQEDHSSTFIAKTEPLYRYPRGASFGKGELPVWVVLEIPTAFMIFESLLRFMTQNIHIIVTHAQSYA
ncbi:MAG: hypothetical protein L6R35_002477 [Caloplaca aegaea]|nr:MAG: hypothetical protein L6R35_002477 [Caloplaca aegaea]